MKKNIKIFTQNYAGLQTKQRKAPLMFFYAVPIKKYLSISTVINKLQSTITLLQSYTGPVFTVGFYGSLRKCFRAIRI